MFACAATSAGSTREWAHSLDQTVEITSTPDISAGATYTLPAQAIQALGGKTSNKGAIVRTGTCPPADIRRKNKKEVMNWN